MAYINTDDFLELFAVASAGQDKQFINTVKMVLEDTPAADVVEVRHGYWYITEYEYINCSECGHMHYTGMDSTNQAKQNLIDGKVPNYCPNCGAKMDRTENNDRV